jgi:tetratricopeptide (TPR) repeat protein
LSVNQYRELGTALFGLDKKEEALGNLQKALGIFQEIRSRNDEADTLKNLAEFYRKTEEYKQALEYCLDALHIAKELETPLLSECQKLKEALEFLILEN